MEKPPEIESCKLSLEKPAEVEAVISLGKPANNLNEDEENEDEENEDDGDSDSEEDNWDEHVSEEFVDDDVDSERNCVYSRW